MKSPEQPFPIKNRFRQFAMHVRTILILATWGSIALPASADDSQATLPGPERQAIRAELEVWRTECDAWLLDTRRSREQTHAIADADAFYKGIEWALRFDEPFAPADVASIRNALGRARQRRAAIAAGTTPWFEKSSGRLACGYVSSVDGSTQPFGIILPKKLDRSKPTRLDVVLHGSSKPVGMSELRFLERFDRGDEAGGTDDVPTEVDYIELHPLGRVENCYRWAGETDVFEAIEAVCQRYNIDRDRIVLRGMSMGASGTWHLGLKHPDFFVALGPYCGYVDTHQFSHTPLPTFSPVDELPPHQEAGLHMLDSIDYAANAGVVPCIAAMGEKDVFFDAHAIMAEAMRREGLQMVNLISPGTGHEIDPITHAEQMRHISAHATNGLNRAPRKVRFVTWTLKYANCHWLRIIRLGQHYARAEIAASYSDEGVVQIETITNIDEFDILAGNLPQAVREVHIEGKLLAVVPEELHRTPESTLRLRREGDEWSTVTQPTESAGTTHPEADTAWAKKPGQQGPIDDAFCTRFLCVRGSGKPWNPAVQAWSEAALRRFAYEWSRYMRGDLPIKDDVEIGDEDRENANLILFGDPGSNRLIAEALPRLQIRWTRETLSMDGQDRSAANHAPLLIAPSPWSRLPRYVVLNSGHTFHEPELSTLNYLLFPRHGDWAVVEVGASQTEQPTGSVQETILEAGFFDEQWRFPSRQ